MRQKLLFEFLRGRDRINVKECMALLNDQVHPRTAQRDLESFPGLKKVGATKGRIYITK